MVNERREGGLLVQLGPQLQAYPQELLRQRRGPDGAPEYLVRWRVVGAEERAAGGGGGSSAGLRSESVAVWLSAEEVRAGCPALLGGGERAEEERAPGPPPAAPDEASLLEMKADVGSLVRRAGRQLGGGGTPASSVLHTVRVLSAYAGIGALAGAFKETGALELLTEMLCHEEKAICRGAGEMLRALASHDAGGGCRRGRRSFGRAGARGAGPRGAVGSLPSSAWSLSSGPAEQRLILPEALVREELPWLGGVRCVGLP